MPLSGDQYCMSGDSLRIGRKKEGDWRERVGDTCYKKSLFCSLLWTLAFANSWLAELWWVTYWHVSWGERQTSRNVFYWHKLWKIKLNQSCSNFTSKTWTGKNCNSFLAGRDTQHVLYTGFVQTPSGDSKRLQFLPDV